MNATETKDRTATAAESDNRNIVPNCHGTGAEPKAPRRDRTQREINEWPRRVAKTAEWNARRRET